MTSVGGVGGGAEHKHKHKEKKKSEKGTPIEEAYKDMEALAQVSPLSVQSVRSSWRW